MSKITQLNEKSKIEEEKKLKVESYKVESEEGREEGKRREERDK